MLQEIRREGGWRCFSDPQANEDFAQYVKSLDALDDLLGDIVSLPNSLKDNHRSLVLKGALLPSEVFAGSIVAKQARNKNRSYWSRALSLVRNGEARQTFLALQRFKELGVKVGEPILVLEKRRFGLVVDSWVVYEYLAGESCTAESVPKIIDVLSVIHQAGYQHKDPTLGNFYLTEEGNLFLIDCVLRNGLGNFSRCRDLRMLVDNNDTVDFAQVAPALNRYRSTVGYLAYGVYRRYRSARDTLKYKLRGGRRPKNN